MSKAAELAKMGEVLTNSQIGGRRNIVINGAMQVAQRATQVTGLGAADGYHTLDRWNMEIGDTSAGRFTMDQIADGPSGFANSLKLTTTTADTSIAAGEFLKLEQRFEGQDLQQLKKGTSDAEKVTVSFYVKGNAAATYTCELEDVDNTRSINQAFAVTTDWTRVILTFAADTSDPLGNDVNNSLQLNIWLHGGATYSGGTFVSNAWKDIVENTRMAESHTSIFDSDARTFFITGVQMEVGSQATPFEHRSFGEELALCHRYCNALLEYGTGDTDNNRIYNADYADANGMARMGYPRMRARPNSTYSIANGTISQDFSSNGLIQLFDSGDTNFYIYDLIVEKEL